MTQTLFILAFATLCAAQTLINKRDPYLRGECTSCKTPGVTSFFDGCNSCTCPNNVCTKRACITLAPESGSCKGRCDGVQVSPDRGCNWGTCKDGKLMSVTEQYCIPNDPCDTQPCQKDLCSDGKGRRTINGKCCQCPATVDPCATVRCTADVCPDGKGRRTINGKCCQCPATVDPCATVRCTADVCPDGKGRRTIDGKCCQCPVEVKPNCEDEPAFAGPCRGAFPRFTFNGKECVPFTYGGCQGNGNNFLDEAACKKTCTGTVPHPCDTQPCQKDLCSDGRGRRTINGRCCQCPATVDPCATKLCTADVCSDGKGRRTINGKCCQCPDRCSTKPCQKDLCSDGKPRRAIGDECCQCPAEPTPRCEQTAGVVGPCEAIVPSVTFQDGKCVKFDYGGCQGNENRFATVAECEKVCGAADPCADKGCPEDICPDGEPRRQVGDDCCSCGDTDDTDDSDKPACEQTPGVVGNCKALIRSFTFSDGKCEQFSYGGCGGNDNRFGSLEACEEKCIGGADDDGDDNSVDPIVDDDNVSSAQRVVLSGFALLFVMFVQ